MHAHAGICRLFGLKFDVVETGASLIGQRIRIITLTRRRPRGELMYLSSMSCVESVELAAADCIRLSLLLLLFSGTSCNCWQWLGRKRGRGDCSKKKGGTWVRQRESTTVSTRRYRLLHAIPSNQTVYPTHPRTLSLVCVCVCVTLCSKEFLFCSNRRGWQQERESATNEDTLDFLVILGLIIPAYLPRLQAVTPIFLWFVFMVLA